MQMTIPTHLPDPQWIEVLRAEAAKPKRTKADIGRELGVSRATISTIVAGKYPAKMSKMHQKLAAKVMAKFAAEVWCDAQHKGLPAATCRELSTATMPMSNPAALRQWSACQRCPQKCEQKGEK